MKFNFKSTFLDRHGNLLDDDLANEAISIDFAEFESCPATRSQRRKRQSCAARQLLSHSLRRFYGAHETPIWPLEKSPSGKPFLAGQFSPSISLAHSGSWVSCAVANIALLGIDIEAIKPRDWEACAQDVFHKEEASWVLAGPDDERDIRGLSCWCRKEAIVKAIGTGMSVAPTEIGFSPDGTLITMPTSLGTSSGWRSYTRILSGKAVVAVVWKN